MNLPQTVTVAGVKWKLFCVDFDSPDGRFSAYFYGIDAHHASYQIEAMKENGVLSIIADNNEDD